jgi:Uso1 / p115 like vesicle tethering protein, head region/Uso1 / p115 like vesicle tethering protein, C terminal region
MAGGIIVLDCLQLAVSLLKGNEPNQRMFAELGYQKILQHVLQKECQALISLSEESDLFSQERCLNIAAALDVLDACGLSRGLEQNEMLPTLQKFAVWETSPPWVRASAWKTLAVAAQHSVSLRHTIEQQQPVEVSRLGMRVPLVQVALHECMTSPLPAGRHAAGDFVACVATPCVQIALLKIVTAPSDAGPTGSQALVHALLHQGSLPELVISSRAAASLAPLVVNNPNTKQEMLSALVAPVAGKAQHQQGGCILDACAKGLAISVTKHGAAAEGQELIANFGTLLVAWLPDFPLGVQQFLSSISKTPFLVGVVLTENNQFGSGTAVIRGYCAVLLGLCCLYAPAQSAVDPKVLLKAVVDQIGLPRYGAAMTKFIDILNNSAAAGNRSFGEQTLWSPAAASWLAGVVGQVHRNVEALAATGAAQTPQQQQPQRPPVTVHPQQQHQQHQPTPQISAPPHPTQHSHQQQQQSFAPPPPPPPQQYNSSPRAAAPSNGVASPRSFMPPPPPTHGIPMHPTSPTFAPGIDQNAYQGLKMEVQQLRERNSRLEKEVEEARLDTERLQQALVKAEADLEGLSTAYTALDSHATELQARLDKALLAPASSQPNTDAGGHPDVKALVQSARKEAEEEASAAMEDLLVCLGQEEAKVEKLEALLAEARLR